MGDVEEFVPVDPVASDGQQNHDSAEAAIIETPNAADKRGTDVVAHDDHNTRPMDTDKQVASSSLEEQQQGVEQQGTADYMDNEHDDMLDYGDDYEEHENPAEEPEQAIAQPHRSPGQATPERPHQQPRLNTAAGAEEGELDMSQDGGASAKTRAATGAEEQGELVRCAANLLIILQATKSYVIFGPCIDKFTAAFLPKLACP